MNRRNAILFLRQGLHRKSEQFMVHLTGLHEKRDSTTNYLFSLVTKSWQAQATADFWHVKLSDDTSQRHFHMLKVQIFLYSRLAVDNFWTFWVSHWKNGYYAIRRPIYTMTDGDSIILQTDTKVRNANDWDWTENNMKTRWYDDLRFNWSLPLIIASDWSISHMRISIF